MRSVISTVALALACVTLVSGQSRSARAPFVRTGENLLGECDFEGTSLADRWSVDTNRGAFRVSTAPGRGGEGTCAKLVSTSPRGRGKLHIEGLKLPAGTDVMLSVWARPIDFPGGAHLNIEGKAKPSRFSKIDIAGGDGEWTRYELRTTTKQNKARAGELIEASVWIYVYGAGTLLLDDIEVRAIHPDPDAEASWAAEAAERVAREGAAWRRRPWNLRRLAGDVAGDEALAKYDALVRACATSVTRSSRWGALSVSPTVRVFRDGPFHDGFATELDIGIARHERQGGQVALFAYEGDLDDVSVSLEEFRGPVAFDVANVEVLPVGFGKHDHPDQVHWYDGATHVYWPDPLLPNRAFKVEKGAAQGVYLRVYCPRDQEPGRYTSEVVIASSEGECRMPLRLTVHRARMPVRLTLKTMMVGGKKDRPYLDLALEQRMALGTIYSGMSWSKPLFPAKGDSFDFSKVEGELQYAIDRGLNAFSLAQTPKSGKWGFPKNYSPAWKRTMSRVVREYAAFLRRKGWLDMAYYNNIDEPWSNRWPQVREIFEMVRAVDPEVRVFSCVNKVGALENLKNHADAFDVYIRQHGQQQADARAAEGKEIWWAVCIWPSERPNVFVENPLSDARVIGWMAFAQGVSGFEYWSMTSWDGDWRKTGSKPPKDGSWMRCADGVLTTQWRYGRAWRNGDGYVCYPGDGGRPVNSLRFEALRDGIEEHELLVQLKRSLETLGASDRELAERLLDGGDGLVTNYHVFVSDADALDGRRSRLLSLLDRATRAR